MGSSIALSADGNTLAVGSADEDSLRWGRWQSELRAGQRRLGRRGVHVRQDQRCLDAAGVREAVQPGPFDLFGIRIALSRDGSVLAAGSPFESGAGQGVNPNQHDRRQPSQAQSTCSLQGGQVVAARVYQGAQLRRVRQFGTGVALTGDGTCWRQRPAAKMAGRRERAAIRATTRFATPARYHILRN